MSVGSGAAAATLGCSPAAVTMLTVTDDDVARLLSLTDLIPALRVGFAAPIEVPPRHHHSYGSGQAMASTLLLMPAWEDGAFLGVKVATVSPGNGELGLPAVHALYVLLDACDGRPLATMDARTLTARRTAATSALAASFLARADSATLLMVGTGALARELIPAHAAVRPLRKVLVWGRNPAHAERLAAEVHLPGVVVTPCTDLAQAVAVADVISCATVTREPLIQGRWLRPGQHLDLVGAYRPDMREADTAAIRCSVVFVDSVLTAPREGGDLAIPLAEGAITGDHVVADLFALCRGAATGRPSAEAITAFKSVGHALEDFVAATAVYRLLCAEQP